MLISELLQDSAVPEHFKTRIVGALSEWKSAEDLARHLANGFVPKAVLLRTPNFGTKSLKLFWPLIEPYVEKNLIGMSTMNFAQELRELITAALEAGVDRDTIVEALEEVAADLSVAEVEKDGDWPDVT